MRQITLGLPVALTGLFQGMLLFYLLACDVLINFRIRIPALAKPAVETLAVKEEAAH